MLLTETEHNLKLVQRFIAGWQNLFGQTVKNKAQQYQRRLQLAMVGVNVALLHGKAKRSIEDKENKWQIQFPTSIY